MRSNDRRWLAFLITTGGALGIWAFAAVKGYGWEMLWLPAVVAGAGWPLGSATAAARCLGRLSRRTARGN